MSIAAANMAPNLLTRRSLVAEDLLRLQEPAVIFEWENRDTDGALYFVYTVAGWLNGHNVATIQGGATVGGQAIIVHADSREHADALAGLGLQDTIEGLRNEARHLKDAQAALARLQSVAPLERLDAAIKPASDKSDAFVNDVDAIRPLIGDDIVLSAGKVEP